MSKFFKTNTSVKQISLASANSLINALIGVIVEGKFFRPSVFCSSKPPKITIVDFFDRILKYCKLDEASFIAMMIYLDRACGFIDLTKFNVHKIILGSMICAIKYTHDEIYANSFYARVGGINLHEMNIIEVAFLELIDFELYIKEEEYTKYSVFL